MIERGGGSSCDIYGEKFGFQQKKKKKERNVFKMFLIICCFLGICIGGRMLPELEDAQGG